MKTESHVVLTVGVRQLMSLTAEDNIVVPPGKVYHSKMVVVIGIDEATQKIFGNLFINSKINPNKYHTEEERADHYPLRHQDYPEFIKKDHDPSFINCALIKEYTIERVLSEKHIGNLKPEDLQKVISILEKTKQITPKIKNRYGIEDKS